MFLVYLPARLYGTGPTLILQTRMRSEEHHVGGEGWMTHPGQESHTSRLKNQTCQGNMKSKVHKYGISINQISCSLGFDARTVFLCSRRFRDAQMFCVLTEHRAEGKMTERNRSAINSAGTKVQQNA